MPWVFSLEEKENEGNLCINDFQLFLYSQKGVNLNISNHKFKSLCDQSDHFREGILTL